MQPGPPPSGLFDHASVDGRLDDPAVLGVAEWLVPLAAAGLSLTMLGAFSTHVRRGDPRVAWMPTVVLGVIAVAVAVGRYWIEPF
jgi:hypothetical protein